MKHLAIKINAALIVAGSLYFGIPALFKATIGFFTISSGLFMLMQAVAPSLIAIALCFSAYTLIRNQENFPTWNSIKDNITAIYNKNGNIGLIKASLQGVFNEWKHFTSDLYEQFKFSTSIVVEFFSHDTRFEAHNSVPADIKLLKQNIGAPIGSVLHSASERASDLYRGAGIIFSAARKSVTELLSNDNQERSDAPPAPGK
ncbi:hypothetical protein EBR43_08610 [bacterium]|nr:hypothetical protein [bacterium]NBW57830.1 hypothetical protein [bacterium]